MFFKVQLFWEGLKSLRHYGYYGFDIYLVNVKTMRWMAQIFVAFSEKLNFKNPDFFFTTKFAVVLTYSKWIFN